MTRTQRAIVLHWRGLATVCAIVALFGIAWATWHRLDASDRNYAAAAAEADRRGDAVSTLAGDVRALREQVKAAGKTPVAPDPEQAVDDLPDRTEVPVPIPGPQGLPGMDGTNGQDGEDGAPGPQGEQGIQGEPGPQGVQGEPGQDGHDGTDGKDGTDGRDGQTCPTGYSLQAPPYDPDALVCRKDSAPPTTPTTASMAALPPDRRRI